jgi:hypothetical protein
MATTFHGKQLRAASQLCLRSIIGTGLRHFVS